MINDESFFTSAIKFQFSRLGLTRHLLKRVVTYDRRLTVIGGDNLSPLVLLTRVPEDKNFAATPQELAEVD